MQKKKILNILKTITMEEAESNIYNFFGDDFDYNLTVASYMKFKNIDLKTAKAIVDYENSQLDQMRTDQEIRSKLQPPQYNPHL
ncbi:hypothetical protein [Leptospira sp. GIMC2001]|uniref:hypothetical protein n=1 Tax=Leptospira sp. GIMC2001 TaxID=1513297 RepID=UPI002349178F|nr:hypothetical protein [Leptospira sp. GIMC2001]WCL49096.1 hypothetical protein O4O04_17670 [Leptospira sp. GIMC2001]